VDRQRGSKKQGDTQHKEDFSLIYRIKRSHSFELKEHPREIELNAQDRNGIDGECSTLTY